MGATNAIVVMGVSGCGKSTVGAALARALGYEFIEGDRLHPAHNITRMASGHALTDAERVPWLHAVGAQLTLGTEEHAGAVASCSALKRSYRDILRGYVPQALFVLLEISLPVARDRLRAREHGLLPPSLLVAQFEVLEHLQPDEHGMCIDGTLRSEQLVERIERRLSMRA